MGDCDWMDSRRFQVSEIYHILLLHITRQLALFHLRSKAPAIIFEADKPFHNAATAEMGSYALN